MKHLWLKSVSCFAFFPCHRTCGEVHSEPTVPNKASQLSACYVCASDAAPYIYRKRFGSFILPLNFLNTKDPTPACLSVCGEADHDTRGKHEKKNRGKQSTNSLSRLEDSGGRKHTEACSERGIPLSRFKWLQMCAWRTATVHIWAQKAAPRLLFHPPSPPHLICITLPCALPWKSN